MKKLYFILITLMFYSINGKLLAQGETCATAVAVLPGIHSADGPATGGGLDLLACYPGSSYSGSADWYSFTPEVDGLLSISHAVIGQGELYVLSGTCVALVCEYGLGTSSLSNLPLTAGVEYFIQWGDVNSTAPFNWTLNFVPENDVCADAINLAVAPNGGSISYTLGSTRLANTSPLAGDPSCKYDNSGVETLHDLFYTFTLPSGISDVNIVVNALEVNSILQFAVWDACGGTELYCNNNVFSTGATTVNGLTGGNTYILQVFSTLSERGSYELGLEAGTSVNTCNPGDIEASLASSSLDYCPGATISFSTNGAEVIPVGWDYSFYILDNTNTTVGAVPGPSFTGDINAALLNGSFAELTPGESYTLVGVLVDLATVNDPNPVFCQTPSIFTINALLPNDPACGPNCQVGNIATSLANTTTTICNDGVITLQTDGNELVPPGETYLWVFLNSFGTIQAAVALPSTYTGAINLDLGPNALPPGSYTVFGAVSDSSQTVICGNILTPQGLTLVVLPPNDPSCGTSCSIASLTAGAQTTCVSSTNSYTQQVVVSYSNAPTTGSLLVNGQSFPIATSPQTITLTNLEADGAAVNVSASFSDDPNCAFTQNNLFVAPAACGTVGIQNLNLSALKIYPNPTRGAFNLSFELSESKDIEIVLMSVLGKEVYHYQASNVLGQFNHNIDVQELKEGVYFVIIKDDMQQSTHKIVINK